jgi:hypothetical protein
MQYVLKYKSVPLKKFIQIYVCYSRIAIENFHLKEPNKNLQPTVKLAEICFSLAIKIFIQY